MRRRHREHSGKRMLRLEVAHRRTGGGPERRFMDAVKEGMRLGGVREEDRSQMEAPEGNRPKQKKKKSRTQIQHWNF